MTRKYRQKVQCPHCYHVMKTRSRAKLVSCGYCGRKFDRVKYLFRGGIGTFPRG